jgi:hypothetical protein
MVKAKALFLSQMALVYLACQLIGLVLEKAMKAKPVGN